MARTATPVGHYGSATVRAEPVPSTGRSGPREQSSSIGVKSPARLELHPFSTPTMPRFPWHRRTTDPQGALPVETRARSTKAIHDGRRASAPGDPGDLRFPSNPATYPVTSCPPRGRRKNKQSTPSTSTRSARECIEHFGSDRLAVESDHVGEI